MPHYAKHHASENRRAIERSLVIRIWCGAEPRRGSVVVKTIDATTTDRLRRSPLYLDLSPSCARKRACMELTTICRFQRLKNPPFRLFQCFRYFTFAHNCVTILNINYLARTRSIASLPGKIVFGRLIQPLFKNSFYHQEFFAVKRRAVFILGAKWKALVRGWRSDCVVGGMETRFQ